MRLLEQREQRVRKAGDLLALQVVREYHLVLESEPARQRHWRYR
jgi:hypothetical protein